MARNPAPTKANLFRVQRDLRFATEGCELLHQKRDVLVMELMSVSAAFDEAERTLRELLTRATAAFVPAYLMAGRETMERLLAAPPPPVRLVIEDRSVMGVPVPQVRQRAQCEPVWPSLVEASVAMDAAIAHMGAALAALVRYIEIVATIWRLATEVEKTQRRINAIENMFIPEFRATVAWIKGAMEENDREELFRRKLLKNRKG